MGVAVQPEFLDTVCVTLPHAKIRLLPRKTSSKLTPIALSGFQF